MKQQPSTVMLSGQSHIKTRAEPQHPCFPDSQKGWEPTEIGALSPLGEVIWFIWTHFLVWKTRVLKLFIHQNFYFNRNFPMLFSEWFWKVPVKVSWKLKDKRADLLLLKAVFSVFSTSSCTLIMMTLIWKKQLSKGDGLHLPWRLRWSISQQISRPFEAYHCDHWFSIREH